MEISTLKNRFVIIDRGNLDLGFKPQGYIGYTGTRAVINSRTATVLGSLFADGHLLSSVGHGMLWSL